MLGIKKLSAVVGAAVVAAVSTYASASTFSFDGSSASNTAYAFNGGGLTVAQVATLKASVSFTLSGNNLVVDITNLQSVATVGGAEIAGVFWDSNTIVGGLTSVALGGSSAVIGGGDPGAVGFSKAANGPGSPGGQAYALTTAGLSLASYDSYALIPGASGTASSSTLDGIKGSIVGTVSWSGGVNPMVQNELIDTINVGSNFDLSSISNVEFYYSTVANPGPGTPPPPPVPLPAAAWSGMALLAGLGLVRKIRKTH